MYSLGIILSHPWYRIIILWKLFSLTLFTVLSAARTGVTEVEMWRCWSYSQYNSLSGSCHSCWSWYTGSDTCSLSLHCYTSHCQVRIIFLVSRYIYCHILSPSSFPVRMSSTQETYSLESLKPLRFFIAPEYNSSNTHTVIGFLEYLINCCHCLQAVIIFALLWLFYLLAGNH